MFAVSERHEEVGASLAEAWAAGKAHALAAAEWRAAALKLRHAHEQRTRLAAADPPRLKKLKALDKDLEKVTLTVQPCHLTIHVVVLH